MRKQELKSRRKVHAHKRRRKGSQAFRKKESAFVEYKPEVITIEIMRKPRSNRKKSWKNKGEMIGQREEKARKSRKGEETRRAPEKEETGKKGEEE